MTLTELKESVDNAIEYAIEANVKPDDITVSVQIDGPGYNSFWSTEVELHYDNDGCASGCVLLGIKETVASHKSSESTETVSYAALASIVSAWDALDEGEYTAARIQAWLLRDMKPAIDLCRKALKGKAA